MKNNVALNLFFQNYGFNRWVELFDYVFNLEVKIGGEIEFEQMDDQALEKLLRNHTFITILRHQRMGNQALLKVLNGDGTTFILIVHLEGSFKLFCFNFVLWCWFPYFCQVHMQFLVADNGVLR